MSVFVSYAKNLKRAYWCAHSFSITYSIYAISSALSDVAMSAPHPVCQASEHARMNFVCPTSQPMHQSESRR